MGRLPIVEEFNLCFSHDAPELFPHSLTWYQPTVVITLEELLISADFSRHPDSMVVQL